MKYILAVLFSLIVSPVFAQFIDPGGGGNSTSIISGSTLCAGCTSGNLLGSSGSPATVSDAGIAASLLLQMPPFTTLCNATGITAVVQDCPAITAAPPLLISGTVLSITGQIGSGNVFIGPSGGNATLSGASNTGVGNLVLNALTTGAQNTAMGNGALTKATGGSNNAAFGHLSLNNNVTGGTNVAVGVNTLTGITAGFQNVAVGYNALSAQTTSASGNTGIGYQAGLSNTSGQNNIYLGITTNAGGNGITTGSGNVVIGGAGITGLAAASTNKIIIGDGVGNIRIDYGNTAASIITLAANTAITGTLTASAIAANTGAQTGYLCYNTTGGVITYDNTNTCLVSSGRYKDVLGGSLDGALDEIMALRPVAFRYKADLPMEHDINVGLIAEEVAAIDERLIARDPDGAVHGVKYFNLIPLLVKAIQEQQARIETLSTR